MTGRIDTTRRLLLQSVHWLNGFHLTGTAKAPVSTCVHQGLPIRLVFAFFLYCICIVLYCHVFPIQGGRQSHTYSHKCNSVMALAITSVRGFHDGTDKFTQDGA